WGYLEAVPVIKPPKRPRGRTRFLSEDEITRLMVACARSKNPELAPVVALAINTGARRGELLRLKWEQVDLTSDFGFSARIRLVETKTDTDRSVPLNKDAVDALTAHEPDPSKRVGRVFRRGKFRHAFEVALERAGIVGCTFHDLRHTAASWMVMRG